MSTTLEPATVLDAPSRAAADWLRQFDHALRTNDGAQAARLFEPAGFWRDLIAFTWNIKTLEGRDEITAMLDTTLPHIKPHDWRMSEPATEADGVVTAWFDFETAVARGKGLLRLRDGLCWTLLTTADELKGHEEKRGATRPLGAAHGVAPGRQSWRDRREAEAASLGVTTQPYVLIVGGGQGGLALGARLRNLDVPTLIVDAHPNAGDQWRRRYKSLCLHDPVWYDHMPYLPFPEHWPVFAPKDKIADWLEAYEKTMELACWHSTVCTKAHYDDDAQEWEVTVERGGSEITLRPKHLVLATGMSGLPNVPAYPGAESFTGEQHHSSKHPGGEAWRGRKAVVIGSNNSAHDICADLWENGADVTMVQRTSTLVARSDSLMELATGVLYSEQAVASGITTERADLIFASQPYRVMPDLQTPVFRAIRDRDAEFYARLEQSGFMLDFGDDESGLYMKYVRRGSGYYIDVGASELIANGSIKLKSRVGVEAIRERSVLLTDGTELPADLIVYATGYGSMNGWAARLISQEVADRVGKCWGLGSGTLKDPGPWEGELRNMWKPTRQDGLWFHGGNLHQSRHYSLYLALQLKARLEGISTPVYGLGEVHHLS
ncbi:flavin-containing monooxygenase [Lichenicoccus roseus]|uniref:NAD(P)/FAD-dependent oxidoreductase n=1 Tax=Lichenicoccus roseus TaxID=2683649 RepID=A0A5R9JCV1_9PROT|nr:NAD(P)/FAD-dependent oxidoreductase [Lichenicoccus roseus]TLU73216.1 NAD(P)/FAD-dependent oxidoreductase [Lichenicoccus roseus]